MTCSIPDFLSRGREKSTAFLEISRLFEDLGLEMVSRNLTLSQQKDRPSPTRDAQGCDARGQSAMTSDSIGTADQLENRPKSKEMAFPGQNFFACARLKRVARCARRAPGDPPPPLAPPSPPDRRSPSRAARSRLTGMIERLVIAYRVGGQADASTLRYYTGLFCKEGSQLPSS